MKQLFCLKGHSHLSLLTLVNMAPCSQIHVQLAPYSLLCAFAISNIFAHESDLITVTILGMCLANMIDVDVDDVL